MPLCHSHCHRNLIKIPRPAPSFSTPTDSIYKKRVEAKHLSEGAPNILIILMDDLGPGTPSTYGGEINTPYP